MIERASNCPVCSEGRLLDDACLCHVSVNDCLLERCRVVCSRAHSATATSQLELLIVVPGANLVVGIDLENESGGSRDTLFREVTVKKRSHDCEQVQVAQSRVAIVAESSLLTAFASSLFVATVDLWQVLGNTEELDELLRERRRHNVVVVHVHVSGIVQDGIMVTLACASAELFVTRQGVFITLKIVA